MYKYYHTVQYYETDKMGVTHHSNYIRIMEESRNEFLKSIGFGYNQIEKLGLFSPVVSVECNFKKSTTYDDVIEVAFSILEVGAARLVVGYTMTHDGEVVCTGKSTHCFIDTNGRPIPMKKVSNQFYETMLSLIEK